MTIAINCLYPSAAGRPESDPPLGILSWSDDAPRAQVDIKLTVNLMDGQPAAGEHLELQVEAVGQWLRLRWTGDGARERARVYELKIERWESRADKPKKVHSLKRQSGPSSPVPPPDPHSLLDPDS